jgi:uncharacterized metal-binding protein
MASGKTHDWVTLAFLPTIWMLCRWGFQWPFPESGLVTFGTFIGGFFLSPDLDTRSRPFYRWGLFRWIWWPYQWVIKHRSGLSHGIFLASWLRLIYLTLVLSLLYIGLSAWLQQQGILHPYEPKTQVLHFLHTHLRDIAWLGLGLWCGAFLHIALDWLSSTFRPRKKRR